MSDFDDNWQLTGSSDPATPDIQPHQVEAQAQSQSAFQQSVQPVQPVQQAPEHPVNQQLINQPQFSQPAASQPVYQQPVYQQPSYTQPIMPGYGYPGQPIQYTNIDYAAERENNLSECARMINHFSPKVDIYQNYEKIKTDIVKYSRTSVAPLVWGIIVSIIGLGFVRSIFRIP